MIIKIEKDKYYGHQNKTKMLFKNVYNKVPKLKWMEKVELNGVIVDGWFSLDKKEYLLKLEMEENFKRFTGNSERMFTFLKNHGAIEVDDKENGLHIDYNDQKGFLTMEDRFGRCVGSDLYSHYRTEEMLKEMPENWGIVWIKGKDVKGIEIVKPKRRIVRRIKK